MLSEARALGQNEDASLLGHGRPETCQMETKRRNRQSIRKVRLIVGALLIGAMFGAAQDAEAKGGGKGGDGKGGGGDGRGYTQYLRALATFDTENPPQYMRWSHGRHDDTLARPGLAKERPDPVRVDCYAKYKYYDWITGTDVVTYSGRRRNCGVEVD